MPSKTVSVVSDDSNLRDSLAELVTSADLCAETFSSLESWLEADRPERRGCLVLDAASRKLAGAEETTSLASMCAQRPVLVLIDRGDVPSAVRAIRAGAVDVVEKPYRKESLLQIVKRAAGVAHDEVAEAQSSLGLRT